MKTVHDLSHLKWKLSGWTPYLWGLEQSMEIGASPNAEVMNLDAPVPGSVQMALRNAGIIPDWFVGLNYRQCEWVENRHWSYEVNIPDEMVEPGKTIRLNCSGLDYNGWVFANGVEVGQFKGSHVPHSFDLTNALKETGNRIRIVFDCPPRWLGQFGHTSRMKEWKVRFNYSWDWVCRLVQIGIWDAVTLEVSDGAELGAVRCYTDYDMDGSKGSVHLFGEDCRGESCCVHVSLTRHGCALRAGRYSVQEFNAGIVLDDLAVELWWPNGEGDQPLYDLEVQLADESGRILDRASCRTGFRSVKWEQCEGAPEGADPWLCVVNGRPVFLQGANWTPILPNFADAPDCEYEKRLGLYRDLGCNILRVWGGSFPEKDVFYDLCDEYGLMVWQEFPLSSSGLDNTPPDDGASVDAHELIARSYIKRKQSHPSLILWCGGNELTHFNPGAKSGCHRPITLSHPLVARQAETVALLDPTRRFLASSSSGPAFYAHEENYGKGIHWDVHGPWKGDTLENWERYWSKDDALFRSETGSPGASSVEIIEKYAGDLPVWPAVFENALWKRNSTWWIEWEQFEKEHGRPAESIEEYVAWSQERQKTFLTTAVRACKERFPRCGGVILWHGHDCFPCAANTAVIDFHGEPKPAALALSEIWKAKPGGH